MFSVLVKYIRDILHLVLEAFRDNYLSYIAKECMINFQIQPRQPSNLRVLRTYLSESYDYLFIYLFFCYLSGF